MSNDKRRGCDRPRWRSGSCFLPRRMEAVPMAKSKTIRKRTPKHVLKLPDLEQSKYAVLNTLTSRSSQRTHDHAIREFIEWYCSEPRLAFNKTVVTRYRISLEQRHYASTTINLRLAAVRRLAYETADCGLLSADLAAGIRRVKGAKRLGVPVGNWLSAEQGRRLLLTADGTSLRSRNHPRPQPSGLPLQRRGIRQTGPLRQAAAEGHPHQASRPGTIPARQHRHSPSPHRNLRATGSSGRTGQRLTWKMV